MDWNRNEIGWTELKSQAKPHVNHLVIQSNSVHDKQHTHDLESQKTFIEIKAIAEGQLFELNALFNNLADIRQVMQRFLHCRYVDERKNPVRPTTQV